MALFGGQASALQTNPGIEQDFAGLVRAQQPGNVAPAGAYGYPGMGVGGGRITNITSTPTAPIVDPAYSPAYNPTFPYNPYYPQYGTGVAGSYYRGLADLTSAYGQYTQDYQRARLINQEAERSKIKTRMELLEELRRIEASRPKADDVRKQTLEQDLQRARKLASITDILSAKSLNDLLGPVKIAHAKGLRGPALPLDPETMKNINLTPNKGINMGLVKTGKLTWPLVFEEKEAFREVREKINENLKDAIERARTGKVDQALLQNLETAFKDLDALTDKEVVNMTTSQYIEARRYLDLLRAGLDALRNENVAKFFDRTYEARGKTAADLFEYMTKNGLVFAPATPGDEAAYRTMYSILAAYDEGIGRSGSKD